MKENLIHYLVQLFFGSMNNPSINHNSMFLLAESIVNLDGSGDLKKMITYIKYNSSSDLGIPLAVVNEWFVRNKHRNMNAFLTYDKERYTLGRITIGLNEVVAKLIMVIAEVVERNNIEIDPFDLSAYDVDDKSSKDKRRG